MLRERHVPFVVKSALLPQNRSEISEFETWAATIPWMEDPPGYAVFLDLRARRDSEAKNRLIANLRLSPAEGLDAWTRRPQAYRKDMAEFCSKFMGAAGDRLFGCGAGSSGCVDAYGKYQLCMSLRHPDFVCDLRKGSLREALTVDFPRMLQKRAMDRQYLERCARCFIKGLCEQCPGKSWTEHGFGHPSGVPM